MSGKNSPGYQAKYRADNRQRIRDNHKLYRERIKAEAFDHYGRICACCGEKNQKFLTFDHKNNDGASKRRGSRFTAAQLKRDGWPTDIQVLCWNCNCGRHLNGGTCPHKE